ncbi:hypothetical protein [Amycolatopsis thermoflava]|uniref:hypothetical protein n=1 Tax=Amycolatopsis thermoflava TaxID=84480 RepID=UPI003EC010E7
MNGPFTGAWLETSHHQTHKRTIHRHTTRHLVPPEFVDGPFTGAWLETSHHQTHERTVHRYTTGHLARRKP